MSNRAKAETAVGESLQTWVEVCFTRSGPSGPETQRLRRVIEAKRVSDKTWNVQLISVVQMGGILARNSARLSGTSISVFHRAERFDVFLFD